MKWDNCVFTVSAVKSSILNELRQIKMVIVSTFNKESSRCNVVSVSPFLLSAIDNQRWKMVERRKMQCSGVSNKL